MKRAAIAAFVAMIGAGQAAAQSMPPPGSPARAEYDGLFERSLANPADLDAAFRFAEAATAVGDYEAAIGVLERMLFFNPALNRVRLELGVLYFRLGDYAQARAYLSTVAQAEGTPPEVRERVDAFLAEIGRRDRTSRLTGLAQAGLRHQSNANAGPASLGVRANGVDAQLDQRFGRKPDWNAFALGGFRHIYDLGNQRGDTWESSADVYVARQFDARGLDVDLGELTTGPRFALGLDRLPGATIRPYVLLGGLRLGGAHYLTSSGVGAGLVTPAGRGTIETGLEFRWRAFEDSNRYPTASQQTGAIGTGFVAYTEPLTPRLKAQLRGIVAKNNADESYYSYDQFGLSVGLGWEFHPPFAHGPHRWVLTPSAGMTRSDYYAANAIVDPNVKRADWDLRLGIGLDAPLTESLGIGVQLQYTRNNSSLPNYEYRNLSISFGPTFRF